MIKGEIDMDKIKIWDWSILGIRSISEDDIKKLSSEIEDDYIDEEAEEEEMMNMNPLNAPNIPPPAVLIIVPKFPCSANSSNEVDVPKAYIADPANANDAPTKA